MKVYIAGRGAVDGWGIEGVFSTREKAEAAILANDVVWNEVHGFWIPKETFAYTDRIWWGMDHYFIQEEEVL